MRNLNVILCVLYLSVLFIPGFIVGWDGYLDWWKHHIILRIICEIVGVLLVIPLFSNKKKEEE